MAEPEPAEAGNGTIRAGAVMGKFSWGIVSDPGPFRDHNEDFVAARVLTTPDDSWDRGPLLALADGMGGHAAGEVASRTAVEALVEAYATGSAGSPQQLLKGAARAANLAVHDASPRTRAPGHGHHPARPGPGRHRGGGGPRGRQPGLPGPGRDLHPAHQRPLPGGRDAAHAHDQRRAGGQPPGPLAAHPQPGRRSVRAGRPGAPDRPAPRHPGAVQRRAVGRGGRDPRSPRWASS